MARSTTPKFQPKLNKKSLEVSQRLHQGDFIDRVERDVLRREDDGQRRKAEIESIPPFKPRINPVSEQLRPRSAYEMSRGDLLRKQANERLSRIKCESEMLEGATFKPEISKKAKEMGQSALKILESEEGNKDAYKFLQWKKEKLAKLDELKQLSDLQKEDKELEGCTFAPVTRDCPAYVRRIAKSMAIVKAARASDSNSVASTSATRPDWR